MAKGIVKAFAAKMPVVMKSRTQASLDKAMGSISKSYAKLVEKGKITEDAMNAILGNITTRRYVGKLNTRCCTGTVGVQSSVAQIFGSRAILQDELEAIGMSFFGHYEFCRVGLNKHVDCMSSNSRKVVCRESCVVVAGIGNGSRDVANGFEGYA